MVAFCQIEHCFIYLFYFWSRSPVNFQVISNKCGPQSCHSSLWLQSSPWGMLCLKCSHLGRCKTVLSHSRAGWKWVFRESSVNIKVGKPLFNFCVKSKWYDNTIQKYLIMYIHFNMIFKKVFNWISVPYQDFWWLFSLNKLT